MIKLMKLEMQKNHIGKYAIKAGIMTLCVLAVLLIYLFVNFYEAPDIGTGFTIGAAFDEKAFEDDFFNKNDSSFFSNIPRAVTVLMSSAFMVFAASMLNNFVLSEYRTKTLSVMYTCPIKRKTIFYAKFATVIVFAFVFTIISTLFCSAIMFFVANLPIFNISVPITSFNLLFFINLIFQAAASSFISLIPLMLGMIKKSTAVTIWSSILVVILMQGTITMSAGGNQFSFGEFAQIVIIPVALIAVGVVVTVFTINSEVKKDLIIQ